LIKDFNKRYPESGFSGMHLMYYVCNTLVLCMFLQLQDLPFMQIGSDGRLTILGTQEVDAGDYECVATNEAGSSHAIVTLDIGCKTINVLLPMKLGPVALL